MGRTVFEVYPGIVVNGLKIIRELPSESVCGKTTRFVEYECPKCHKPNKASLSNVRKGMKGCKSCTKKHHIEPGMKFNKLTTVCINTEKSKNLNIGIVCVSAETQKQLISIHF